MPFNSIVKRGEGLFSTVLDSVSCHIFQQLFGTKQLARANAARCFIQHLCDRLGAFRDGVLGQFSGKDQATSGLNLSRGQGALLVVAKKPAGLGRNLVEHVVGEGVHHGHAAGGNAGVGVNLLQHLVDVGGVRLLVGLALLLALRRKIGDIPRGSGGLGGSNCCNSFRGHCALNGNDRRSARV
jgi:hypothetical protein